MVKFSPLPDRVVVRRLKEEEKSKGGIIITDTAKEKPQEDEIIGVGPGARGDDGKRFELGVAVGDRIVFGKWSGSEDTRDGKDLIIMSETDILGVIAPKQEAKKAA